MNVDDPFSGFDDEPGIGDSGVEGVKGLKKIGKLIDGLKDKVREFTEEIDDLAEAGDRAGQSLGEAFSQSPSSGSGSRSFSIYGRSTSVGGNAHNFSLRQVGNYLLDTNLSGDTGPRSGGGGYGAMRTAGRAASAAASQMGASGAAAGGIGAAVGGIVQAGQSINSYLNTRIDANQPYSLAADRMTTMYMGLVSMSRERTALANSSALGGGGSATDRYNYAASLRAPLRGNFNDQGNLLLGAGGINDLLELQALRGISANQQALSVSGLRAMSGFSLSSSDILDVTQNLASPEVANRMFMTTGMSFYNIGGGQKSTTQVIQEAAQSAGLLNYNRQQLQDALTPGSVTRSRLQYMGLSAELQDQVLMYAQNNLTFREETGQSTAMYDPGLRAHRDIMGIDDTYASETEETTAARVEQEEKMYSRQKDNFAELEQRTRALIETFTKLDELLSGITGVKISTKPFASKAAAMGTQAAIGGAIGFTIGGPPGALVGAGFGLLSGLFSGGDGPVGDGGTSAPAGPTNTASNEFYLNPEFTPRYTEVFNKLSGSSGFSKMHPTMQQRVATMIAVASLEGVNLKLGTGYRSEQEQANMFFKRYSRTDQAVNPTTGKDNIQYDGSFWQKNNPADADAAPPGRSMHEIGLAADMAGANDWVVKNAHRFGLKHFADVNNEPWHVQPAELPNARAIYERDGAPWGMLNTSGSDAGATSGTTAYQTPGGPSGGTGMGTNMSGGTSASSMGGVGVESIVGKTIRQKLKITSVTGGSAYDTPTSNVRIVGQPRPTGYTSPQMMPAELTSGDPVYADASLFSRTGAQSVSSKNYSFNIAPVINLQSTGSATYDAKQLVKELSRLLEQEMRTKAMRNS